MLHHAAAARCELLVLGAVALSLLCPEVVSADPPRSEELLAMRSTAARDATVGELSRVPVKAEAREQAAPATTQAAAVQLPAAHIRAQQPTPNALQSGSADADVALIERCYELARRSDASLSGSVTVHLAAGGVQVKDENLGNGHYVRCLQREFGRVPVRPQLPAADTATRVVVVGAVAQSAAATPTPAR